ncbi:hypothetical protein [Elusimicrobium minutum]|uniref:hypothetical protein n=1 Tax=Elusimicrobium minutum TaxID=423605 RepID=UPI00031DC313|nr:hypothetical protein [Elusimicrobium minutum]
MEAFILSKAVKDIREIYCLANGVYSTDFDELDIEIPGITSGDTAATKNYSFNISVQPQSHIYVPAVKTTQ